MVKYPKLISAAKQKLACIQTDAKAAEAALLAEPDFAVKVGNACFTERVDGGTVLLEAVSKCKNGKTTHIGEYKGFEILAERNYIGLDNLVLRGKTEYKTELSTSPVGSMVKLENLFHNIPEGIKELEKRMEQYQRDMEQSKAEYEKPFVQETELIEKSARLKELDIQLDLENGRTEEAILEKTAGQDTDKVAESGNYQAVPDKKGR